MRKRGIFLPLLLIFCLLSSVVQAEELSRLSFTGQVRQTIPPPPPLPFEAVPPIGRPDDDFTSFYEDTSVITPAFKRVVEEQYKKGRIEDAYKSWLRLAWHGDMFAMATLPTLIRAYPERQWPVQPEFWENWLIDLLGEGEGAYVLGAQYAMLTKYRTPGVKLVERKAGEFFVRSALAGNHAGMIGAEETAVDYRSDQVFTPPAHPVVTPVPAHFYSSDKSGEGRYWLSRAADEGYGKACIRLAILYENPGEEKHDYDKAKHYYMCAANAGSLPAATAIIYTKAGDKLDKMTYETFHRKRKPYDSKKEFAEKFSELEFYTYMTLQHLISDFGSFTFDRELVSLARELGFRGDEATIARGIAEGRRIYGEWKKPYLAEQLQKAKHYAQARARLPEVMADYAKHARDGKVLVCARDDAFENLKSQYDDTDVITMDFRWIQRNLYACGQFREAYDGWLELAWLGDMFAMATLPAVSRVHPELQWPVPPEFWENWLIDLLGEGEGAYVLGAQYAMLSEYAEDGTPHAERKAAEFFLRSALTGHHPGMLGAAMTARCRQDHPFTPPPSPAVSPIPVRFYGDDKNGEARYWLTRAADEGYWKACLLMAQHYESPKTGEPDYARAEQYYERAARRGSDTSALLIGECYLQKLFSQKTFCEGFHTYLSLAFIVKHHGEFEDEQRKILEDAFSKECGGKEAVAPYFTESIRLYEEGMARCTAELKENMALYAKARARLPEVRAAFDKRLTAGTPAKMRGGGTTPPGPK